jgi:hypothetical protein
LEISVILLLFLFIFQSISVSHTTTSQASNMALCATTLRFCHSTACMTDSLLLLHCLHWYFNTGLEPQIQHSRSTLFYHWFHTPLSYCQLNNCPCSRSSCLYEDKEHTTFFKKELVQRWQVFLQGMSDYAHVRPFSHDIATSRQCRKLRRNRGEAAGTRSSQIMWQYYRYPGITIVLIICTFIYNISFIFNFLQNT